MSIMLCSKESDYHCNSVLSYCAGYIYCFLKFLYQLNILYMILMNCTLKGPVLLKVHMKLIVATDYMRITVLSRSPIVVTSIFTSGMCPL